MWNTPYTLIKTKLTNSGLFQNISIIKSLNEQDIQNGLCPSVLILEGQIDTDRLVNSSNQLYSINTGISLFIILENPMMDDATDTANWSILTTANWSILTTAIKAVLNSSMQWKLLSTSLAERVNGKSIYIVDFIYEDEFKS